MAGLKGGGVVRSDGSCCCPIGGYYGPSYGPYGMLYSGGSGLGGGFEEIILNPGCCINNSHWPLGLLGVAANWRVLSNFGNPTPAADCECTQYNNQTMHYMTYAQWTMDRDGGGSEAINFEGFCSYVFGATQPSPGSCIWSSYPSLSCNDPNTYATEPEFSTCPKWYMWCFTDPTSFPGGIVFVVVQTFQNTAGSSPYDTRRAWSMPLDNFNPVGTNNFGTGSGSNAFLTAPCTNMDPLIITPA